MENVHAEEPPPPPCNCMVEIDSGLNKILHYNHFGTQEKFTSQLICDRFLLQVLHLENLFMTTHMA